MGGKVLKISMPARWMGLLTTAIAVFAITIAFAGYRSSLVALIVIFGLSAMLRSFFSKASDFLQPQVLMPFTFLFYALGPMFRFGTAYSPEIWTEYLLLMLLGLIALRVGLGLGSRGATIASPCYSGRDIQLIPVTGIVLFILSVFSIASFVLAIGGIGSAISLGYGPRRYVVVLSASQHYFGDGFELLLLLCSMYLFYLAKTRKPSLLMVLWAGLLFVTLYYQFMIGARSELIYAALFAVALYQYGIKKISARYLGMALILGMALAQYWSYARFWLPEGPIAAITVPARAIAQDPTLLLPSRADEFQYPGAALLEILNSNTEFWYGRSYLRAFEDAIPFLTRFIGEIGANPSNWRLMTFHPKVYAEGGGYGFSPVAEGYLNFGVAGVVLQLFLYGLLAGWLYRRLLGSGRLWGLLFWAGALPMFMFMAMRMNLASFLTVASRTFLVPGLLALLFGSSLQKEKGPQRNHSHEMSSHVNSGTPT